MCGIACIIHQDDPSQVSLQKLQSDLDSSLSKIKHRGPDARGQWISPDKRIGEHTALDQDATAEDH